MVSPSSCLSNADCPTAFCNKGACAVPAKVGDSCSHQSGCLNNLSCHPSTLRCVTPGTLDNGIHFCQEHEECPPAQYCQKHTHLCDPRGGEGAFCGPSRPCLDGLECWQGRCIARCLTQSDCRVGGGEQCAAVDHISRDKSGFKYKLCVPPDMPSRLGPYMEFFVIMGLFLIGFLVAFLFITRRPRPPPLEEGDFDK